MNLGELFLNLAGAALGTVAESKLVPLLQDLHDSNPDDYKAAITGGHALVKHLGPLTSKSATKIDDMVVQALDNAINESAAANGISFDEAEAAKGTEATSSTPEA